MKLPLDKVDIDFIVTEMWKSKSPISGTRIGCAYAALFLVRWRRDQPISPGNVVLLTDKEAQILEAEGPDGFDPITVERIDERLKTFGAWH